MTALPLPAIRALHAGITPGPWETMKAGLLGTRVVHVDGEWDGLIPDEFVTMVTPALRKPADAAFIAAAPSIVTQLLAKVEAQQSALAKVELACDAMDAGVSIRAGDPRTKSHAATAIRAAIREALGEDA